MKKVLIAILGAVVFFIGCADKNNVEETKAKKDIQQSLFSKEEWKIHSYKLNGSTKVLAFDKENTFTIGFKDGQIYGVLGCNNFFGSYGISGDGLSISNAGMTRKMCESKVMEIENDLSQNFLNASNRVEVLEDGKILIFRENFYLLIQ